MPFLDVSEFKFEIETFEDFMGFVAFGKSEFTVFSSVLVKELEDRQVNSSDIIAIQQSLQAIWLSAKGDDDLDSLLCPDNATLKSESALIEEIIDCNNINWKDILLKFVKELARRTSERWFLLNTDWGFILTRAYIMPYIDEEDEEIVDNNNDLDWR